MMINLVIGYSSIQSIANRVEIESIVMARNSGEDFLNDGGELLKRASEICTPFKKAFDTWKDVKFDLEFTDTVDPKKQKTKQKVLIRV